MRVMARSLALYLCAALLIPLLAREVAACTGITLRARDGSVVVARTNEWALGDMDLKIGVFPRGRAYVAQTPDGQPGRSWKGAYGFVSMTAYGQPYGPDGMNEAGLSVGMFYLPGYAEYAPYQPSLASETMSVGDLMQWMLSSFATVAEVRAQLSQARVCNVEDPRFGGAPLPFHWKVTDPSGAGLVIEYVRGGVLTTYEPTLGVITNSPTYDWHVTNLNNYLKLSPEPARSIQSEGRTFGPFGAGSGMVGLPGDFSPPSRFVRAAALTATARPLADAQEALDESFRILDSFNIPLGAVLTKDKLPQDIASATQITSSSDLSRRIYCFHTQWNRRVRSIDLKAIDFATVPLQFLPVDPERAQDIEVLQVSRD
jgi:choloylglycine hydrolase